MDEIVILNLADTHITDSKTVIVPYFERAKLSFLKKLEIFLKSEEGKNWHPHFICICGDIANSGKVEEYQNAEDFIQEICKICQLPAERVNMVPGNHDMNCQVKPVKASDTKKNDAAKEEERNTYVKYVDSYFKELNDFFQRGTLKEGQLSIVFKNYADFRKKFITDKQNYTPYKQFENKDIQWVTGIRTFPEQKVAFWELNNTWQSLPYDPHSERAYHMKFGQHIIMDMQGMLEELKNKDYLIISLFHHSFFKLAHEEYQPSGSSYCMYDAIIELSDICLSGHEHGPNTKDPDFLRNSAQYFLNGSFFATGEQGAPDSSFSMLKINRKTNSIEKKQFCYRPNDNEWEIKKTSIFQLHLKNYRQRIIEPEKQNLRIKTLQSRGEGDDTKQNAIIEAYWGVGTKTILTEKNLMELPGEPTSHFICFINMDDWDKKSAKDLIASSKDKKQYPVMVSCYASWEAWESKMPLTEYEILLKEYREDILSGKLIFFMTKFEKN